MLRGTGGLVVAGMMVVAATPASAQGPVQLKAGLDDRGYISLRASAPEGGPIAVSEVVRGRVVPVLEAPGPVAKRRALTWRCDRLERRFVATARASGRSSAPLRVRTPSCRKRLKVILKPSQLRAGRPLSVLVLDSFRSGDLDLKVCASPPGAKRRCRNLRLPRGRSRAAVRFKTATAGRWPVSVTTPGAPRIRHVASVRRRGGGLRILATGDSMIQIVDSFLQQRLQRGSVKVRKESHISTGISKPSLLNWNDKARSQASGIRPDASVVFLGANDGFPIGRAQCCGRGWVRGYTRRVRDMMSSYSRRGAGTVYWLTLPVPRRGNFKPIYRAVNTAIRRAARSYPDTARIVDAERVFTPGRRYTSTIRYGRRTVHVRQSDGVHLNITGASIAANLVIRAMRRDGVL